MHPEARSNACVKRSVLRDRITPCSVASNGLADFHGRSHESCHCQPTSWGYLHECYIQMGAADKWRSVRRPKMASGGRTNKTGNTI